MRWCVIRHPDIEEPAVIPETSLVGHQYRGWQRVSGWESDQTTFHLADYLDAAPIVDEPAKSDEPAPAKATSTKEKSK